MRMLRVVVVCVLCLTSQAWAVTDPTLPTATVDTTFPTVTGTTYNATCATLQTQIDTAAAADTSLTHEIILATGTICTGPYVLKSHIGTGWILIKGENFASLPASGTRVTTSDASLMPQIKYGEDGSVQHVGCFSTATNARRYRIIGIDCVENTAKAPNWAMVTTGYGSSGSTGTGWIILDRMVIRNRAWSTGTYARRGVYGDGGNGNIAILDSIVSGIADTSAESQAWLSVNNPGPILIQNSEIEASGENFMFCGSTPVSSSLQPSDITIKKNLFSKQSAWFGASGYTVKTEGEMKCGKRTLIEANTFQNMPYNDGGFAHRLTPRNDDYSAGSATFLEVSDLTIRYNLYRDIANWINMFGSDDGSPCGAVVCNTTHSKRWKIHDNLVYGLGHNCGAGADCGTITYITTGGGGNNGSNLTAGVQGSCTDPSPTCKIEDLQILHNTVDLSGGGTGGLLPITSDGMLTFFYKDNLINTGGDASGIYDHGNGWSSSRGTTRLNEAVSGPSRGSAVGWVFTNNRFAHNGTTSDGFEWSTSNMPTGNTYVASYTNFQWNNPCTSSTDCSGTVDYTLNVASPAKNAASDGTDQGVNFTAYNAARTGIVASGSSSGVRWSGGVRMQ